MNKRLAGIALLTISILPSAFAQRPQSVLDIKQSISDNNIIYPESFETDTHRMLEGWYMKNYTATDDRFRRQPDVSTDDRTMRDRLAKLPTIIDMPYNQVVRSYIDRYTQKGREQVVGLLGLSIYYMPIFEQALEEQRLPLELKYLPLIESGLNPNAVSKNGAAGLWQFMISTAKGLDLEVSSLVDERRDPYLSSRKAVQYLADLYQTYGDWGLAIAAYNCGPSAVNKAIRRAGGDPKAHNFWTIYNYLPAETRGYYPAFIAANYVMNYYPEHNISPVLPTKPLIVDTLHISDRVHFNQISAILNIPVDELRLLNPQFRADIIPGSADKRYTLALPSQQVQAYLMCEDKIKSYDAEKYQRLEAIEPGGQTGENLYAQKNEESADDEPEKLVVASAPVSNTASAMTKQITHKVSPGETLATIAIQYDVTPNQIKSWNNLRRNAVRTGQLLRIKAPVKDDNTEVKITQKTDSSVKSINSKTEEHAVRDVKKTADNESSKKETVKETVKETAKEKAARLKAEKAEKARKEKEERAERARREQERAEREAAKPKTHKLKSGDNLSALAKRYGVSVEEIKKANNMKDDDLRAGDDIKIPGKKKSSSKSKKRR